MHPSPTGVERIFDDEEIIVSKTDLRGVVTYANDVFLRVSGYREDEIVGAPHSLIRHPGMPRCIFKLLWESLAAKNEIFAYVVNLAKNGDHYWVFAHVTPTFDRDEQPIGYHSSRRRPERRALDAIEPIYRRLLDEERKYTSKVDQMAASGDLLRAVLAAQGAEYDQFVLSL